jgi:hypothetical protein
MNRRRHATSGLRSWINIEIPKKGIYFSTCQPNILVYILAAAGGRGKGV